MKQKLPILTVFLLVLTLSSCENVLDCIINVRPELHDMDNQLGYINQYFRARITAEIKNEPRDNSYDYYFDISGELPRGLEVVYDAREIVLRGIPVEKGRFRFRVYLNVDPYEEYYYDDDGGITYNDDLCTDSTSREYVIQIR